MTHSTLSYRGYLGSIEVDVAEQVLYGRVLHVNDAITYRGKTIEDLQKDFEAAVEDYLAFCEEVGDEPDKPYSGTLQVRIGPELHRLAHLSAAKEGVSLNAYIKLAVEARVHGHSLVQHAGVVDARSGMAHFVSINEPIWHAHRHDDLARIVTLIDPAKMQTHMVPVVFDMAQSEASESKGVGAFSVGFRREEDEDHVAH